ncbi:ferredoxin family protein [Protofrankia symbiont of Coriaria ruscifolia]|uniref:ferredoxin family protein n=1 Tax=Protofrankia symbiont of Coriaria ruscifolia TaxID=1306542 RepID=UPI001A93D761|nr:4Fe-4S dicluster domain-containing protein [Protofrankia symbiont of Coriaria ruscifolia]
MSLIRGRRRRAGQAGPAGPAGPTGPAATAGSAGMTGAATDERWNDISFEDRMATVDFRVGERAHIVVDSDVCRSCTTKACVTACPANLFAPTADGGILFNYEQCFECGTCYMVCNGENAIRWTYPDGGQGVVFRRG